MLELIKSDLAKLGVKHDVFFSERTLHGPDGDIAKTLAWLREKNMVYEGRLEPPKGKTPDDWEDREQTLFRAADYGDDTDRALVKSDGSYTYFAADIAYHRNKYLRGFNHMVNVLGADHSGYVKRLQAAVKAVSEGEAEIDVKIMQLVRLMKNGEPFKMSKRSGDLVLLSDVVEEVGSDATRFMLLYRRNDAAMDFDFALVKEQSRDNPVFYVQYAHARACSVFRVAERDVPVARHVAGGARWRGGRAAVVAGRSRTHPDTWRSGRGSSREPRRRTNRTASRSTFTSWPARSTDSGRRAKKMLAYALLTPRTRN
jgi:arginyl-tRNA synthetase